jgi:hypothetical protein
MQVFGLAGPWNSKHAMICYGFETILRAGLPLRGKVVVHGHTICEVPQDWAIALTSILALSPVAG